MGKIEDQIVAQNSAFFATYAADNGGTTASSQAAYSNVSPYLDGRYFTGVEPLRSIPFLPFVAVIDLETGMVLATDILLENYTADALTHEEVIAACTAANTD